MQCSENISVVVKPRRLNGRPNASACSQMHNNVYFLATEGISHRIVLSKINVADRYVFGETSDIRVLDLRIVKIVKTAKKAASMPTAEQLLSRVGADEAGAACDQDSHQV